MGKLDGKVAVVAGGGSGIGRATVRRIAQEGAFVYAVGRRLPELERVAMELGENVRARQADVSNVADLDALFGQIQAEKGRIDIVVAAAGIMSPTPLAEAGPEHFDNVFGINARGLFFTVQKALPLLSSGSSVILISSVTSQKGIPGYSTYSATKAAVRSFARTWTKELTGRGIRFNTISPGPIDTALIDARADTPELADKIRANFSSLIPLGRMGKPEEVASAALFLASDESSFIAGIDLQVDGGMAQV
ncbi:MULTISPECIES: SDR family NAD(P)-dependent oxidoreductase [unclassified Paraburkholderia]|uniref:SDR family NAD(P)-dependent oxidoreductase n=1 Tax=unclassified Paraburkholderia TaxID=2615204 RepID=UPI00161A2ED5|nr:MULTISPECIES: SDR family oxidoreductase [unclassified Paraburkholderia]MBB5447770.1 NAD(P)-dependent dehydrogenase (short-subunit alcohol dehydrogenase family) [Paraburkholderia sp. WSM4177]MBB5488293.1 NAD(P)-dependent dehydrogenase (short-subunit alcohol dehydrogenase family) [Paraburkholderia sp. WSM4180]